MCAHGAAVVWEVWKMWEMGKIGGNTWGYWGWRWVYNWNWNWDILAHWLCSAAFVVVVVMRTSGAWAVGGGGCVCSL